MSWHNKVVSTPLLAPTCRCCLITIPTPLPLVPRAGQLDDALATDFESVGQLFGRDTNGDLVVDRGVGVALQQFVTPYVQTGGIVASRTDSLDTQIDNTQNRIARYNERLQDYEQQLRNDFGRMEGMMNQLQDSATALDRLGGPSNQNGQ